MKHGESAEADADDDDEGCSTPKCISGTSKESFTCECCRHCPPNAFPLAPRARRTRRAADDAALAPARAKSSCMAEADAEGNHSEPEQINGKTF